MRHHDCAQENSSTCKPEIMASILYNRRRNIHCSCFIQFLDLMHIENGKINKNNLNSYFCFKSVAFYSQVQTLLNT